MANLQHWLRGLNNPDVQGQPILFQTGWATLCEPFAGPVSHRKGSSRNCAGGARAKSGAAAPTGHEHCGAGPGGPPSEPGADAASSCDASALPGVGRPERDWPGVWLVTCRGAYRGEAVCTSTSLAWSESAS